VSSFGSSSVASNLVGLVWISEVLCESTFIEIRAHVSEIDDVKLGIVIMGAIYAKYLVVIRILFIENMFMI
jgi:hypothetical protein